MTKHKKITVMAVASFEGVRKGDVAEVEKTPRIEGLLKVGYLRKVEDVGTVEHRPGGDPSSVSGSGDPGTDGWLSARDEPSEGSYPS